MDNLHSLLHSGMAANTIVMVSAQDLRECIDRLVQETKRTVEEQYQPVYLTREEVLEMLHISNGTLYNFIKDGRIKPVMVGDQKRYIRSEIDEAVRSGKLRKYIHK